MESGSAKKIMNYWSYRVIRSDDIVLCIETGFETEQDAEDKAKGYIGNDKSMRYETFQTYLDI